MLLIVGGGNLVFLLHQNSEHSLVVRVHELACKVKVRWPRECLAGRRNTVKRWLAVRYGGGTPIWWKKKWFSGKGATRRRSGDLLDVGEMRWPNWQKVAPLTNRDGPQSSEA
jgi:hypothetical protein